MGNKKCRGGQRKCPTGRSRRAVVEEMEETGPARAGIGRVE